MRFLVLQFFIATLLLNSASAIERGCDGLLLITASEIDNFKFTLKNDLRDPVATVRANEIAVAGIQIINFLGAGHQGAVFTAELSGQLYALKVFFKNPHHENYTGAVIQKTLGDIGISPRLIGSLSATAIKGATLSQQIKLHLKQRGLPEIQEIDFAILMELVPSNFLKKYATRNGAPFLLSTDQRSSAFKQAHQYLDIFEALQIEPQDMDAVMNSSGYLLLTDFGYYQAASFEYDVDLRRARLELLELLTLNTEELSPGLNESIQSLIRRIRVRNY